MKDIVVNNKRNNSTERIYNLIKKSNGLTITEIVDKTRMNRSSVRTALAKLEGAQKVFVRKIGMAKLYFALKRGIK